MKTIFLSSDHSENIGHFRAAYPRYERVQRRTPSGRIYDSLTMTNADGSGVTHTSELAVDGRYATRSVCSTVFFARQKEAPCPRCGSSRLARGLRICTGCNDHDNLC